MYRHLTNLPVFRPASHPPNEKFSDYLLTKTEMTSEDSELLDGILSRYQLPE